MKERGLIVDAREAKGLHDGSITRIMRVMRKQPIKGTRFVDSEREGVYCVHEQMGRRDPRGRRVRSPFGAPGDRLRAVCPPGEPCEHRGCLSHVTHVCEGCGRGHAGILLDVTDVRVVRVKDIAIEDARAATGCRDPFPLAALVQTLVAKHVNPWGRNLWLWLATVAKVNQDRKTLASEQASG